MISIKLHVVGSERPVSLDFSDDAAEAWAVVVDRAAGALGFIPARWQFLDDEGDFVTLDSQAEWEECVRLADKVAGRRVIHLEATPPTGTCLPRTGGGAMSCMPGAACDPISVSRDPQLQAWLDLPVGGPPPEKIVNPDLSTYTYKNEALRAVTLPLGPNGGGCIAVAGDGGLRQWQISNRIMHTAHVPNSFFAIRTVDSKKASSAVVLQSSTWYDQTGFQPAPMVSDHEVPPASIQLLQDLPGVKTVEITARYPIVDVSYPGTETPVNVSMQAFNPCIPLNSQDSGIPAIIFKFSVQNPTSAPIDVSLLFSQQNIGGWDGASQITNENCNPAYGGNVNSFVTLKGLAALDMANASLRGTDAMNGHVAPFFLTQDGDKVTSYNQYESHNQLWHYFTTTGLPGQGQPGASPSGKTWNGAICATRTVGANATSEFTFGLAWHFPNRYVNWSQAGFGIPNSPTEYFLGNQYAKVWPTINEVMEYVRDNIARLTQQTTTFRDAMFQSKLPWQLIDSAAGRIMPIRSPSSFWIYDGSFYSFEGCSSSAGCCPLNCTHVLDYAMALSRLWPDLERSIRTTDLDLQLSPNGILPSRTSVPPVLRRQWTYWPDYTQKSPDQSVCSDGEICCVLKTYREILMGADAAWAAEKYHQVQKIMTRWMTVYDSQGTGLVTGPQPSTYDCAVFGANTFMGSLYLAALRASEEMAKLQNDQDGAKAYRARFELATAAYDKTCFNGDYYIQVLEKGQDKDILSDGTFVDALLGQWWAYNLGLGDILPRAHCSSTVARVFKDNHVDQFDPARQHPRKFFDQRDAGLYICTWGGPSKPAPPNAMLYTSEGAWTGLEYPFGGLALQLGLNATALQILQEAREKYDGTRRSPWNEIECGDHYTRQMAGFALFEIASGQLWSGPAQSLAFAPRLMVNDFSGFFITDSAWGQYVQQGDATFSSGTAQVNVQYGTLTVKTLMLATASTKATVAAGTTSVPATTSRATVNDTDFLVLTFSKPLSVPTGSYIKVSVSS